MIISNNRKPEIKDFSSLVAAANQYLNDDAKGREKYYLSRNAQKLEDDVAAALTNLASGTPFENTIQVVSGQRFPDIVAGKYYGVEVKSSKDELWTTLGGSVNESTRVEDVERIFLTFGKLVSPIEFRSRPYEECLSEVVVTHYPRYKINMNLGTGNTIFDKMNTTYDKLRNSANPVSSIVEYYKTQLKEGESLWWIDSSDSQDSVSTAASMKVKLWRTLSQEEKHDFMISAFALFPDVLSDSNKKYENFSLWLASRFGIVSTSLRDTFTAGGQEDIFTISGIFHKMPQAIYKLFINRGEIALRIMTVDEKTLKETWKVRNIAKDRIGQWIDIVSASCTIPNFKTSQVLQAIFYRSNRAKSGLVAENPANYE